MAPRKRKAPKRTEILSSSPLVEITLLHRAMRLELESMCRLAESLVSDGGDDPDAVLLEDNNPSLASSSSEGDLRHPPEQQHHPKNNTAEGGGVLPAETDGDNAKNDSALSSNSGETVAAAPRRPRDSAKNARKTTQLDELLGRFLDFDVVFSSHSSAEDDFIFPMLASRGSNPLVMSQEHVMREHAEETTMMADADTALRRAAASGTLSRSTLGLVRHLKEKLSEHMLMEEEALFPSLASFSSDELSRMVGLVMGSRSAEALEATIRMEVTHLDAQHARHVLSTMCHVSRGTHFKRWLDAKFKAGDFDQAVVRARRARRNRIAFEESVASDVRVAGSDDAADDDDDDNSDDDDDEEDASARRRRRRRAGFMGPSLVVRKSSDDNDDEQVAGPTGSRRDSEDEDNDGKSDQLRQRKRRATACRQQRSNDNNNASSSSQPQQHRQVARCPRYGHRASLVAACCGARVCCRRCHDERRACATPMDARQASRMACAHCGLEQPVAAECAACGVRFASYFCACCNHFDDTGAPTYHCPYCNVCRRGHGLGIDYAHCMTCNHCVLLSSFASHFCAADVTCAVCGKQLFASTDHVVARDGCGHPRHANCVPNGKPCLTCFRRSRKQQQTQQHVTNDDNNAKTTTPQGVSSSSRAAALVPSTMMMMTTKTTMPSFNRGTDDGDEGRLPPRSSSAPVGGGPPQSTDRAWPNAADTFFGHADCRPPGTLVSKRGVVIVRATNDDDAAHHQQHHQPPPPMERTSIPVPMTLS